MYIDYNLILKYPFDYGIKILGALIFKVTIQTN